MSRGALSWFHNVSTYNEQIINYWTKFLLKIHLNSKLEIIEQIFTENPFEFKTRNYWRKFLLKIHLNSKLEIIEQIFLLKIHLNQN